MREGELGEEVSFMEQLAVGHDAKPLVDPGTCAIRAKRLTLKHVRFMRND